MMTVFDDIASHYKLLYESYLWSVCTRIIKIKSIKSGKMISWRTVITQMATRLWNSPSWVSYQWDLTCKCKWGTIQTAQDTLCLVMIVFQLFQSRRQSISGLTWHCTRVFMILLFLFSLSFWTNALFHNRALSIHSDPFPFSDPLESLYHHTFIGVHCAICSPK